jgi:hypothetical protein
MFNTIPTTRSIPTLRPRLLTVHPRLSRQVRVNMSCRRARGGREFRPTHRESLSLLPFAIFIDSHSSLTRSNPPLTNHPLRPMMSSDTLTEGTNCATFSYINYNTPIVRSLFSELSRRSWSNRTSVRAPSTWVAGEGGVWMRASAPCEPSSSYFLLPTPSPPILLLPAFLLPLLFPPSPPLLLSLCSSFSLPPPLHPTHPFSYLY